MEEQTGKLDKFLEDIRAYIQTRQELLKLQVTEKIARIFSNIISILIILSFFIMAFLFVSFTLAHLFGEWWGHEYAGYLTVTALYSVIGILLVKFRKGLLLRPIMNIMIRQILSK